AGPEDDDARAASYVAAALGEDLKVVQPELSSLDLPLQLRDEIVRQDVAQRSACDNREPRVPLRRVRAGPHDDPRGDGFGECAARRPPLHRAVAHHAGTTLALTTSTHPPPTPAD